jgi:hypothetical protein
VRAVELHDSLYKKEIMAAEDGDRIFSAWLIISDTRDGMRVVFRVGMDDADGREQDTAAWVESCMTPG